MRLDAPVADIPRGSQGNILAEVAELADALASGASGGNPVEVRVLFSAPVRGSPRRRCAKPQ